MPWIRPQDQMPLEGEEVLITDNKGMQIVAWWNEYNKAWHSHSEYYSWRPHEVLYWMPLPEPPKR